MLIPEDDQDQQAPIHGIANGLLLGCGFWIFLIATALFLVQLA